MKPSKKSLENLNKRKKFPKSPQGLDEAKSNGQINLSIEKNILATLRTEIKSNTTILKDLPQGIQNEVKNGKYDNAIKLLNIIKEPEEQNINLNGGLEVQKIYIEQEQKRKVDKHIDDFINGK